MQKMRIFDVIIIGGSHAGLSAGLVLGRSLRNVLVIDSAEPCNRLSEHVHSFLTQDGQSSAAILQKAKEQVYFIKQCQSFMTKRYRRKNKVMVFQSLCSRVQFFFQKKLLLQPVLKTSCLLLKDLKNVGEFQCYIAVLSGLRS